MDTETLAQQLFDQNLCYSGSLKQDGFSWTDDFTQRQVEASNCRFHAEQFLQAIDALGYELHRKPATNPEPSD